MGDDAHCEKCERMLCGGMANGVYYCGVCRDCYVTAVDSAGAPQIAARIEAAIAATTTSQEARQLAADIAQWQGVAQRRGDALFVREARQRIVACCADPAVREFVRLLAIAERAQPGSLGSNGAWQPKLWAVFGKDVTNDLVSRSEIASSSGDTVEFHVDWLEQLAAGTFDVDAPHRWITYPDHRTPEVHETPLGILAVLADEPKEGKP